MLPPAFQQEAEMCQELHSHPALPLFYPEICGRVHKGCKFVSKLWHQPLHLVHGKINTPIRRVWDWIRRLIIHSLFFFSVQFACKASVVFCHYCMMTNFFWLLVEALYLNSLLLSSFYHSRRCLWGLSILGWGEKLNIAKNAEMCLSL